MAKACPICGGPIKRLKGSRVGRVIACPADGEFEVTLLAEKLLIYRAPDARKRALLWAHVLASPACDRSSTSPLSALRAVSFRRRRLVAAPCRGCRAASPASAASARSGRNRRQGPHRGSPAWRIGRHRHQYSPAHGRSSRSCLRIAAATARPSTRGSRRSSRMMSNRPARAASSAAAPSLDFHHLIALTQQHRAQQQPVDRVVFRDESPPHAAPGRFRLRQRSAIARVDAKACLTGDQLFGDAQERLSSHRPYQIGVEAVGLEFLPHSCVVPARSGWQRGATRRRLRG